MNPPIDLDEIPIILSYGLGWDSTALGVRDLQEPGCWGYSSKQRVWITSMLGNEHKRTIELVENHILPLLPGSGIRFIQTARAGESQTDGVTILHDSAVDGYPTKLYAGGDYTLAEHLMSAGVVPYRAQRYNRLCSLKFKAFVIDEVVYQLFGDRPRKRYLGFREDERKRATAESGHSIDDIDSQVEEMLCQYVVGYRHDELKRAYKENAEAVLRQGFHYQLGIRADEQKRLVEVKSKAKKGKKWRPEVFDFPLIRHGWGMEEVYDYVRATLGVEWRKSSCTFCPYTICSGGIELLLDNYADNPEDGALSALIEYFALAMNPTQTLYNDKYTVPELLAKNNLHQAIECFNWRLEQFEEWAVYVVRRLYPYTGEMTRQTKIIFQGTRSDAIRYIQILGQSYGGAEFIRGAWRFHTIYQPKDPRPAVQEQYVACPVKVAEKQGKLTEDTFTQKWKGIVGSRPINLVA